ncbi:MAG: phosphomannomutase/phosphoglucomutase [bacterium]|nr:phosphomannomutase/phosphoglucomutase [bacterium]
MPFINPKIFREYDIRGIVDRDLTPEVVRTLGQALGTHLGGARGARIALSRDNRHSSPAYYDAMREGLSAAGCRVVGIGMGPTPALSFAIHHLGTDGGVQITGSHNPPEFNGFKISRGTEAIHGEEIQEIRRLIEEARLHRANSPGSFEEVDVHPAYIERLARGRTLARPIKIVVDSGNGTGGIIAPEALRRIGAEVVELYCTPDADYPHHHPDPTVPANLKDLITAVQESGAGLGVAFDGDADRIGAVDPTGRIVWGDELMILFAGPILTRKPGAAIVFDVKCSSRLQIAIQEMGGRPIMSATGHSLIRERLVREKASLAGELSGHIFFEDDYYGFDDGIYAAVRLLHLLSESGKTLAELMADLPPAIATPEIRIECAEEEKFAIVEALSAHFRALYETVEIDGVRITFPKGWGLVRASNTQPALTLRFEAEDEQSLGEYKEVVFSQLQKFPSVKLADA